jgi:hypothetical protein
MAVILIVEDEVFIREMAEMMIQDWGHHTLCAGDVDEALSPAPMGCAGAPPFDGEGAPGRQAD